MKKEAKGVITSNIIESIKANKKPLNTNKTSVLVGQRGNIQNLDIEVWDKAQIKAEIANNPKLDFMKNEEFTVKGVIEVKTADSIVVAYMNNNLLAMLIDGNVVTVEDDGKSYSFDYSEVEFTATSVTKTNVSKFTAEQLEKNTVAELREILDNKKIDYKSSNTKPELINLILG